jgi:hypothetical protein
MNNLESRLKRKPRVSGMRLFGNNLELISE